ncbi:MAG TPA: ATP-binding protein [Acetivibrio clariflavus]|nr:ATP-binding protein [Acetivibrio clariflavus]
MFKIKKLLGQIRKAIEDYNMIQEGDRIAVGVSGGKDSITLLVLLKQLQSFYPVHFDIEAVTLTMGIGVFDLSPVVELCKKINVNYTIEETVIGKIVFEARNEKNPCSLCANLRRGALHNVAKRLNCNKVALAHHRDDVIETFLLSTLYAGKIQTFSPVTFLERKELYLIRPMIYIEEKHIKEYIKSNGLPVVPSPCHVDGKTKRQYVKDLLADLHRDNRTVKNNIFGAIKRLGIDKW